ncbi:MAG: peptidase S10 [Verrucomicrobia bacterium]|nr:peptidase S10 [Verrucomicrobiota bacterium]
MRRVLQASRAKSTRPIVFRKHLCRSVFSFIVASATLIVPLEAASHKGSEVEANEAKADASVTPTPTATPTSADKSAPAPDFKPESSNSSGSVTVEGNRIDYQAVAGTLVVHPKGWDDAAAAEEKKTKESEQSKEESQGEGEAKNPTAEASMFYVAYTKQHTEPEKRPITFLFNGGPGSSTVWLHMGAFGPRRVITADNSHTPAAPYQVVNNDFSLLDASDLVFVDAPGTGFSRIAGKNKEKEFYGVDQDAHAFAEFIVAYLTKYGRWNSPKYLFGESYGTPRSAVLSNLLEQEYDLDLNGVMLLSQILNFDLSADRPESNPAIELPYVVALPTYAASAWYHHKLPGPNAPADLEAFLKEVEDFATTQYAHALAEGATLPQAERQGIAEKLHQYTGLPVSYILKANLRIDGGEFEKNLQDDADMTTGRLDTRFSGPTMDPLSKEAEYDPQAAAISSAYVSAFNDYVRKALNFGQDKMYRPQTSLWRKWDFKHEPPGARQPLQQATNTMPDLARAMKYNPDLRIFLAGGYFDLATPFYEGWVEMHHLPIPASLQDHIQYHYYQSGHMVYAHQESLKALHDDAAAFIQATDHLGKPGS